MKLNGNIWQYLFVWLMLDSLILYLLRPLNLAIPINAALPLLVVFGYMIGDKRSALLPIRHLVWMGVMASGFLIAIAIGASGFYESIKDLITAFAAFVIGYNAIANSVHLKKFYNLLLIAALAYCVICVLALLGTSKQFLPVINSYGFNKGIPVIRAEITTDQNYQIYYLFPLVLGLAVGQQIWKHGLILIGVLAALYTIIELETRSGLILLALGFVSATLLPAWYGQRGGLTRIAGIAIAGLSFVIYKLQTITQVAQGMTMRFTDSNMETFWGRIESIAYLFTHVYNPFWWIPQGTEVFQNQFGYLPHSSPTKIFLEAGMLGLVAWFALLILPVIKGILLVLRKKITPERAAIVLGATLALIASMTLPASMFEQSWLWAGACWGALSSRYLAWHAQRQATTHV